MPRGDVGAKIAEYDDLFEDWFEDEIELVNFADPDEVNVSKDQYLDVSPDERKPVHPDYPKTVQGQISSAGTGSSTQSDVSSTGRSMAHDVEVYVDEDLIVTAGGAEAADGVRLAYPTLFKTNDRDYEVIDVFDRGNGTQLALAQYQNS